MRLAVGLLVPVIIALVAVWLALRGNHHAFDMRYAVVPLILCIPYAAIFLPIRQTLAVTGLCLFVAGAIMLADHYNVLVEYNRWLKRGQPTSFTVSSSDSAIK